MPSPYRTNDLPGTLAESGSRFPPEGEFTDRGIATLAEAAECIGGQLGFAGDRQAALLAALLVRHLIQSRPRVFEKLPRWLSGGIPGDIGNIVCGELNKLLGDLKNKYHFSGLDQVQEALYTNPLVKRFLRS
jgi:hypothetical protein